MGHFAATHVLALYGALRANSQIFGRVVQRFATTEREVWITIDDGPFPEDTAALLEVLARQGAPATFFLEGARVQSAPELAQRITATGHTLGNHSHTHPVSRFWALGPRGARRMRSRWAFARRSGWRMALSTSLRAGSGCRSSGGARAATMASTAIPRA